MISEGVANAWRAAGGGVRRVARVTVALALTAFGTQAGGCSSESSAQGPSKDAGSNMHPCSTDKDCPLGHPCIFHPPGTVQNAFTSVDAAAHADAASLGDAGSHRDADASTEPSGRDAGPVRPDAAPSPSVADSAPSITPLFACSLRCDDATCKRALGTRAECYLVTDRCENVDCGRTVPCEDNSTALYCDVEAHSCHRSNGQCGTVAQTAYPCPNLSSRLPAGVSISCDSDGSAASGVCNLHTAPANAPLPPNLAAITFASPADGFVFPDASAVVFTYDTTLAHFLLVTETIPSSLDEVTSEAIWGVALPSSQNGERRVRWSDGFAIESSVWQSTPGSPPLGRDLFAMIVGVNGSDAPAAGTPRVLRFRVGPGWALPGSRCGTTPAACTNPVLVMGCVSGACALLCLKDADCPGNNYCDFGGSLPHCVAS